MVPDGGFRRAGESGRVDGRSEGEEALGESERRFATVVSNARAYAYRCLNDPGYPNEYASEYALHLTGYPPEDLLVGGGVRFGELILEEDRSRVWQEIQEALAERRGFELRYAIRRRDGQIRHVREHGQGVYDGGGGVVALEGMVYDVTELVEAEERLREAEERYRTLVERIPAVTFIDRAERSGRPHYVSPQVERMLGYTPEEWIAGRLWRERLHPEDRERILASDERFEANGEPVDDEYRLLAKDGSVVWIREVTELVRGEGGEALFVQGILSDVTGRKEAEEALKQGETRLAEAQRIAHVGSWEWEVASDTVAWSDELYRIFGRTPQEFGNTYESFLAYVHPDDRRLVEEEIRVAYETGQPFAFEHRVVRPDGGVRTLQSRGEVFTDEDGERVNMAGTAQDITERKALEERLVRQAFHDSLTGLPNRHLFVDRLAHALEYTRRRGNRMAAVLFMDLDNFKSVNDSLGHEVGDRVLVILSERLMNCLRPEDTLARFGGDEFVVLIDEVEELAEAVRVAERITEELRGPLSIGARKVFARASIGVALGSARTKGPQDLLRDADIAMYRAKEEGQDYRVFDPAMYEQAFRRLEMENDLRRGVEAEQFVVHYQPIVDLETGGAWGMEALVRWNHPERGLLEPSEFMPVFEESGLVVPVGERVLDEACRQAQRWKEDPRTPPLVVSVNLSVVQLRRSDLARTVAETLRRTGLEASRLSLDVTETASIRGLEDRTSALDSLKDLGVGISIDDFGVGYSSLSYLKRLPADVVKIDKSFVRGVGETVEDTAIVRMVIDLAHPMGMKVVAEGVEGWAQAALLLEMGCDLGQGFYFSEPLPPEEVFDFLSR